MNRIGKLLVLSAAIVLLIPGAAQAYIGPGAGMALAGSLLAVFGAMLSAFTLLLTWPVRLLLRLFFSKRSLSRARFKRVVVLGLDGMDYGITQRMLDEGQLPHLASLRDQGCFKPLGTTLPPLSPVAWSSFQTGVNPGKHNIFDFLEPDRHSYKPKLSSVEIQPPGRHIKIGKYQIPLGRSHIRLLRKSKPFWNILSEHGIVSAILRVPITFPAEKLRGVLLSAMCVPDLRGTQGMFSFFSSKSKDVEQTGGEVHHVTKNGDTIRAELIGPGNPMRIEGGPMKTPFVVTVKDENNADLKMNGVIYHLERNKYTDWIKISFIAAPGMKVYGVCRFLLLTTDPDFGLYVTPINIDPESPVMPVGYPKVFSIYLAKQQGTFATLGLAEDTWSLNEKILGDEHFIQQCLDADSEREAMFLDALEKVKQGLCVCVFDGTDRLQHMFWRDIDAAHPARANYPEANGRNVIQDLYLRMDDLVGRTIAACDKDTLLMVLSDHGFNSFRRGLDLNRWLEENGYLKFLEGRRGEEFLAGVDWSQTRAFALGLAGIFINIKDKYAQGTVDSGAEAEPLRAEISEKLGQLIDPKNGERAIKHAYIAPKTYRGPYKNDAPDLVIGYQRGYRVSWETAIGRTTEDVFHDNIKAWSGDHCVDPSLVPGVLFCNQNIKSDRMRLMDVGPTILEMFGLEVPGYMDGKPWEVGEVELEQEPARQPELTEVAG